jgi:hypothetical protein
VLLLCVSFKLLHVRYKYHKKGLQMFKQYILYIIYLNCDIKPLID